MVKLTSLLDFTHRLQSDEKLESKLQTSCIEEQRTKDVRRGKVDFKNIFITQNW